MTVCEPGLASSLKVLVEGPNTVIEVAGQWDLATVDRLSGLVREGGDAVLQAPMPVTAVRLDIAAVRTLDTVGALLLGKLRDRLATAGLALEVSGGKPAHRGLLALVWQAADDAPADKPVEDERWRANVERVGFGATRSMQSVAQLLLFFATVLRTLGRVIVQPGRIRLTSVFHHLQHVGLNALPILGLLAFLIGIVLGYQGVVQLERVGAESLITELVGLSVLREMGSLVTAIIVAGRSGSAFTAQIGTMKVTQEVDAMQTMGLDPMELLVVPRVLSLMIALPLLTFFANLMAILGAASMTYIHLEMNVVEFFVDLRVPIDFYDATLGIIKAPVFALMIAMVGCHEGLRVGGSAESVGLHTTKAVVKAIFLVIVMNAFISVIATALRI